MASKYDKKQGLDGIATLTNDRLATYSVANGKGKKKAVPKSPKK